MSQTRLKEKYLRRAHQLVQKKAKTPRLQASVEPFRHRYPDDHGTERYRDGLSSESLEKGLPHLSASSAPDHRLSPVAHGTGTDHQLRLTSVVPPLAHPETEGAGPKTKGAGHPLDSFDCGAAARSPTLLANGHCGDDTLMSEHTLGRSTRSVSAGARLQAFPLTTEVVYVDEEFTTESENDGGMPRPLQSPSINRAGGLYSVGAGGPLSSTPRASVREGARSADLAARLHTQGTVNTELKRLLVASVGSQLQHRLEQLAAEKAGLSRDLDTSLTQLAASSEDLDRLAIECDVWRSKYLASRLMVDELAGWKTELSRRLRESRRALEWLGRERAQLARDVAGGDAYLGGALEALEANGYGHTHSHAHSAGGLGRGGSTVVSLGRSGDLGPGPSLGGPGATLLEVAAGLVVKAEAVSRHAGSRVTAGVVVERSAARCLALEPTAGEKLAQQALQPDPPPRSSASLPLAKLRLAEGDLRHPPLPRGRGEAAHRLRLHHSRTGSDEDPRSVPFRCRRCRGSIAVV